MIKDVNPELEKYIQTSVFPQYKKNEAGHGIDHIKTVIQRSLKLNEDCDLKKDIIYTIARYHDIGH